MAGCFLWVLSMNLFDPKRPCDSRGIPQLIVAGMAMAPHMIVMPVAAGECSVSAFVLTEENNAAHFTKIVQTEFVGELLEEYVNDPEDFLMKFFGWAWRGRRETTFEQLFGDVL